MKKVALVLLAGVLVAGSALVTQGSAEARRHYTITQRQVSLNAEVTSGLKSNELTLKEAQKLRDRLAGVEQDISKMKAKNGGKLSYEDEGKVEKKLNSISIDMQKEKLQKRVTSK